MIREICASPVLQKTKGAAVAAPSGDEMMMQLRPSPAAHCSGAQSRTAHLNLILHFDEVIVAVATRAALIVKIKPVCGTDLIFDLKRDLAVFT